jgi:hypothetical protein
MEEGVVLEHKGPSLAALLRWSGLALVAGGLLLAVATALHPSRETTATILQGPSRSGWGGSDWRGSCLRSWAQP